MSGLRESYQSSVSGVQIWTEHVELLSPAEVAALEASLDSAERARAGRFHFKHHRNHYVASRGLLRQLLGNALGQPASTLVFEYGARGKPVLTAAFSRERTLHFNLSHSAGWTMFALAWDREIGIDLESAARLKRDSDDLNGLAKRVLSTREFTIWQALPDMVTRETAFLRAWTRKEAYAKATGAGLFETLTSVEVALDAAAPQQSLTLRSPGPEGGGPQSLVLYDLPAPEGFLAAIAIAQTPEEDR